MEKQILQDTPESKRKLVLSDSCDSIETIGYMKPFTKSDIQDMKDELAETSIEINEIELEKKSISESFKARMKPLATQKSSLLEKIKNRSEYVKEDCYKIIDHNEGRVGYYNASGLLIEDRSIRPEERQGNLFAIKTGTND